MFTSILLYVVHCTFQWHGKTEDVDWFVVMLPSTRILGSTGIQDSTLKYFCTSGLYPTCEMLTKSLASSPKLPT